MPTYGYSRVSTIEQATDRGSLDDQVRRITGAAMMRGDTVARVFSDPGVSGATPLGQRPGGAALLTALRSGDTVVAAKMDRIFRSAEDALVTAGRLQERGIRLVIADMGPDPVTENGAAKLFFTMLAAFAEFERNRIAERVMDGRRAKARAGGFVGGHVPYGYQLLGSGRNSRLQEEPGEQAVIARARTLATQGSSLRSISRQLEVEGKRNRAGKPWHPEEIRRMVSSAALAGKE